MQPQSACNEPAKEQGVENLETRVTGPGGEDSSTRYDGRQRSQRVENGSMQPQSACKDPEEACGLKDATGPVEVGVRSWARREFSVTYQCADASSESGHNSP